MSDVKLQSGTSSQTPPASPLSEILNAHAGMETQCGEIYVQFAATFAGHPELKEMWTTMALEEGGHAAMIRAVNRGLLSGLFKAKSPLLPFEYLESLAAQLKEYKRRAGEGVGLDEALRITWELECSELDFMRELLVGSSNVAELGLPTSEAKDKHFGRMRQLIQKHATDETLRREVTFISSELLRPLSTAGDD